MLKYRIRFAKYDVMRYVGHLDLMRFFQKALNRAQVPLAYSQGYHPHPLISFAAPLSVGVTSGGEYMDIVTEDAIDIDDTCRALNAQMVDGVAIVGVTPLSDTAKNAMAAVEAAAYYVYLRLDPKASSERVSSYYNSAIQSFYTDASEIIVTKQTKKSERQIDLKPLVYAFEVQEPAEDTKQLAYLDGEEFSEGKDSPIFYMKLKSGSTDNIKPELLMEHFFRSMGIAADAYRLGIHRIDMYQRTEDGTLVSLGTPT